MYVCICVLYTSKVHVAFFNGVCLVVVIVVGSLSSLSKSPYSFFLFFSHIANNAWTGRRLLITSPSGLNYTRGDKIRDCATRTGGPSKIFGYVSCRVYEHRLANRKNYERSSRLIDWTNILDVLVVEQTLLNPLRTITYYLRRTHS